MYEYCKMSCIYFSHTIRFNKKTLESTIIIASHFLTISSVWNSNERQFLLMSSSRRSYNKHKHCFITVVQTNRSLNDLGNQESEKIDIIVYNSPKTFRFRYVYIHRFWQNDLKTLCLVFFLSCTSIGFGIVVKRSNNNNNKLNNSSTTVTFSSWIKSLEVV